MDPALLERAITPRTKAVIPVHLFGQTADMDPIMQIASEHGLSVIEDACQAHGATVQGKEGRARMGDVGCFSFYPGKNLGAYGEAGAVVTNNDRLAERVAILRDHGQGRKYYHSMIGWNGRMDGFQGAVLDVKLKYLEDWNRARRRTRQALRRSPSGRARRALPTEKPYGEHVFHVYAVRVAEARRAHRVPRRKRGLLRHPLPGAHTSPGGVPFPGASRRGASPWPSGARARNGLASHVRRADRASRSRTWRAR